MVARPDDLKKKDLFSIRPYRCPSIRSFATPNATARSDAEVNCWSRISSMTQITSWGVVLPDVRNDLLFGHGVVDTFRIHLVGGCTHLFWHPYFTISSRSCGPR